MRFVTPVKTVNSRPNRKYFGSGHAFTWYNFVSDLYSGFHGIVVPGTLRDSIFVLEGLTESGRDYDGHGRIQRYHRWPVLVDGQPVLASPIQVGRYSGGQIKRPIMVPWMSWPGDVLNCRK